MERGFFTEESRFGDIAIAKGYASSNQVMDSLLAQIAEDAEGMPHRSVGEILCEMGVITSDQAFEILNELACVEISDEARNKVAASCSHNLCCLSLGQDQVCPAKKHRPRQILPLQSRKRADCPFLKSYKDAWFCICPVRVELYERYGV